MSLFSQVNHHHKNGEFKNDFVSANQDYFEIYKPINWADESEIDFELSFNLNSYVANDIIISFGSLTSTPSTGCFYIRRNSDNILRFVMCEPSASGVFGDNFTATNGDIDLKVNGGEIYVNNVSVYVLPSKNIGVDPTYNPTIGKYSFPNGGNLTSSIFNFRLEDEFFNSNEKSGYRVYGNQGSFGTRATSNAGGLSYINSTMIQKI